MWFLTSQFNIPLYIYTYAYAYLFEMSMLRIIDGENFYLYKQITIL